MCTHIHTHSCAYKYYHVVLHYYSTVVRCDYQLVFNVDPHTLDKGERLEYGESMMTHAMVLTAVNEKQVSHQKDANNLQYYGNTVVNYYMELSEYLYPHRKEYTQNGG